MSRYEIEPGVFRESPFGDIQRGHFKAIYADPAWSFRVWNKDTGQGRSAESHYGTMSMDEIAALPVADLAADDCVLFMWACWPSLPDALRIIEAWGFTYKTCGFDWMKAHAGQIEMFRDDADVQVGMGYWTRANSEPCLLATRGKPKRKNADVRMGIIEPRRQHSRKPDCVPGRIERLVDGPVPRTLRPHDASRLDPCGAIKPTNLHQRRQHDLARPNGEAVPAIAGIQADWHKPRSRRGDQAAPEPASATGAGCAGSSWKHDG